MNAVKELEAPEREGSKRRHRVSFSLEAPYTAKLKEIAARTHRTATQEIRLLIDQRAAALGLEPVKDLVNGEGL